MVMGRKTKDGERIEGIEVEGEGRMEGGGRDEDGKEDEG